MSIATPFLYVLASIFAQGTPSTPSNEAEVLMHEVANAQLSDAHDLTMTNFNIELFLRDRGEHPREFGFFLQYANSPREIFELIIDDVENNTQVRKGFNGKQYWLQQSGEDKQILSGHEFTEDRQAIEDGIDLSADLMLLLDLHQLANHNPPSKLSTTKNGTRILEGTVTRQQQLYTYRIHIKADEILPSMIDFILFDDEHQQLQFQRFATLAFKPYDGRQIPQVIYEFADADSESLPRRIYEIHNMTWGPQRQKSSDDKKPSRDQHN